mgnify:CR=1 FL=1
MTGIPNYYIQIWEKYVGKVKPEGGDRCLLYTSDAADE